MEKQINTEQQTPTDMPVHCNELEVEKYKKLIQEKINIERRLLEIESELDCQQ